MKIIKIIMLLLMISIINNVNAALFGKGCLPNIDSPLFCDERGAYKTNLGDTSNLQCVKDHPLNFYPEDVVTMFGGVQINCNDDDFVYVLRVCATYNVSMNANITGYPDTQWYRINSSLSDGSWTKQCRDYTSQSCVSGQNNYYTAPYVWTWGSEWGEVYRPQPSYEMWMISVGKGYLDWTNILNCTINPSGGKNFSIDYTGNFLYKNYSTFSETAYLPENDWIKQKCQKCSAPDSAQMFVDYYWQNESNTLSSHQKYVTSTCSNMTPGDWYDPFCERTPYLGNYEATSYAKATVQQKIDYCYGGFESIRCYNSSDMNFDCTLGSNYNIYSSESNMTEAVKEWFNDVGKHKTPIFVQVDVRTSEQFPNATMLNFDWNKNLVEENRTFDFSQRQDVLVMGYNTSSNSVLIRNPSLGSVSWNMSRLYRDWKKVDFDGFVLNNCTSMSGTYRAGQAGAFTMNDLETFVPLEQYGTYYKILKDRQYGVRMEYNETFYTEDPRVSITDPANVGADVDYFKPDIYGDYYYVTNHTSPSEDMTTGDPLTWCVWSKGGPICAVQNIITYSSDIGDNCTADIDCFRGVCNDVGICGYCRNNADCGSLTCDMYGNATKGTTGSGEQYSCGCFQQAGCNSCLAEYNYDNCDCHSECAINYCSDTYHKCQLSILTDFTTNDTVIKIGVETAEVNTSGTQVMSPGNKSLYYSCIYMTRGDFETGDVIYLDCKGDNEFCHNNCGGVNSTGYPWQNNKLISVPNDEFYLGHWNLYSLIGTNLSPYTSELVGSLEGYDYGLCFYNEANPCGNCSDGVRSDDEIDIDYGGRCGNCSDGNLSVLIQEVSIDYGGLCGICQDNLKNGNLTISPEKEIDYGGRCGNCSDKILSTRLGESSVDYGGKCGTCYDTMLSPRLGETEVDYNGTCGQCDGTERLKDSNWVMLRELYPYRIPFNTTECTEIEGALVGVATFIMFIIIIFTVILFLWFLFSTSYVISFFRIVYELFDSMLLGFSMYDINNETKKSNKSKNIFTLILYNVVPFSGFVMKIFQSKRSEKKEKI